MTSSNSYHLVKRRYFANLGISPPKHVSVPSSLSPSSSSPTSPSNSFNIASQSVPSDLQAPAQPSLWGYPHDDTPDLLGEDSSSFDMEMDSIFEFDSPVPEHVPSFACESDVYPIFRSGAQNIPSAHSSDSSSVSSSEEEESIHVDETPHFVPPHLLSSRSGFSFFEYERSRRAAKRAF